MGQHGGDIYSEEIQKQIAKEDRKFLDFSANINPLLDLFLYELRTRFIVAVDDRYGLLLRFVHTLH